jgi:hypothetical protein
MMNEVSDGRSDIDDDDVDEFGDDDMATTIVMSDADDSDNVGDSSVEINVEELISRIEQTADQVSERKKQVRRRLEELAEMKALEDTFAFDFDD